MQKFRAGDSVKITSGKDSGKEGKIEKVFPGKGLVLIPGINMYKKHVKGRQGGQKAGIYDLPRPFNFAKIAIVCKLCKKITRIGFKTVGERKVRICRKCKRELDVVNKPKKR